ncbi:MAG: cytochrome c [Gammaproteobacteria bacterium]|nr:cytochrome c [Gammaproteobacteria bacterium]
MTNGLEEGESQVPKTSGIQGRLLLGVLAIVMGSCGESRDQKTSLELPEPESSSALLYLEKCSTCHAAPAPGKHSARLWPAILQRMQMRMKSKGVQQLSNVELSLLVEYLQKHGKQSKHRSEQD